MISLKPAPKYRASFHVLSYDIELMVRDNIAFHQIERIEFCTTYGYEYIVYSVGVLF